MKASAVWLYDPAGNSWQNMRAGPGHSCGLLFDAKRKIIWGIDTHDCRVYALHLEVKGADVKTVE